MEEYTRKIFGETANGPKKITGFIRTKTAILPFNVIYIPSSRYEREFSISLFHCNAISALMCIQLSFFLSLSLDSTWKDEPYLWKLVETGRPYTPRLLGTPDRSHYTGAGNLIRSR